MHSGDGLTLILQAHRADSGGWAAADLTVHASAAGTADARANATTNPTAHVPRANSSASTAGPDVAASAADPATTAQADVPARAPGAHAAECFAPTVSRAGADRFSNAGADVADIAKDPATNATAAHAGADAASALIEGCPGNHSRDRIQQQVKEVNVCCFLLRSLSGDK